MHSESRIDAEGRDGVLRLVPSPADLSVARREHLGDRLRALFEIKHQADKDWSAVRRHFSEEDAGPVNSLWEAVYTALAQAALATGATADEWNYFIEHERLPEQHNG